MDNQKNYASLSPEEKEKYKKSLIETEEILSLQAKIAKHRAEIKMSQYNELEFTLRLFQLKNPEAFNKETKDGENLQAHSNKDESI